MTPRRRDPRFYQLVDLAKADNEEAIHDLWLNYRHDYAREGDPRDSRPTQPMSEPETQKQKNEEK
jgi:hypothetical protein